MQFPTGASNQKIRTFACKNAAPTATNAYKAGTTKAIALLIVDLVCRGGQSRNSVDRSRRTAYAGKIRARGAGREHLHGTIHRAHFPAARCAKTIAVRAIATRISQSKSRQSRAKGADLWRIGGRWIFGCRSGEKERSRCSRACIIERSA